MQEQQGHRSPDLTGLATEYAVRPGRGLRWLLGALFALNALSVVLRLTDDPDGWDVGLSLVVVGCWGLWFYLQAIAVPATRLTPDGPAVRRAGRWRRFTWDQVRGVSTQTRWTDASLLLLVDGAEERLAGMPVEDAQRLRDALEARTAS